MKEPSAFEALLIGELGALVLKTVEKVVDNAGVQRSAETGFQVIRVLGGIGAIYADVIGLDEIRARRALQEGFTQSMGQLRDGGGVS